MIILIAGLIAWRIALSAPSWYHPPDAHDPAISQLADDVEYRLVEEVHRPRSEPFTLRLREEQANAWLAARLPRWIAGRNLKWPDALGTPQVRLTEDSIELACGVRAASGSQVLVAHLKPRMEQDRLILAVTGITLGRIPMRITSADALMHLLPPDQQSELIESELGVLLSDAMGGGAALEPIVTLSDGRLARIEAIDAGSGHVDLTLLVHEKQ